MKYKRLRFNNLDELSESLKNSYIRFATEICSDNDIITATLGKFAFFISDDLRINIRRSRSMRNKMCRYTKVVITPQSLDRFIFVGERK